MDNEEKAKEKVYKTVRKVLDLVHDGGNITNRELEITINNATPVVELLGWLGPKYHLAWKELSSDIRTLEGFREARKRQ